MVHILGQDKEANCNNCKEMAANLHLAVELIQDLNNTAKIVTDSLQAAILMLKSDPAKVPPDMIETLEGVHKNAKRIMEG